MIKLEKIEKSYRSGEVLTKALSDINLEIKEGEFVSIMGPSGSGKSTLMHILGFLDKPSFGKYFFEGEEISYENDDELAKLRNKTIGFVFQAFNLLARTSVLDNVILPLHYGENMSSEKMKKLAKEVLEEVGMTQRMHHFSNQLSGGEKQRVAIARALINDPKVIFADEPTGNLDSKSGDQIMHILQKLNGAGRTVILVTHEEVAARAAKRIVLLKDGKVSSDKEVHKRWLAGKGDFSK